MSTNQSPAELEYNPAAGQHAVTEHLEDWHDIERRRDVPVRVYSPADADGPLPLVLFSPGLGASRDYYEFLSRHWASRGHMCINITHVGTDSSLWRDTKRPWPAMCQALDQPWHRVDRSQDVIFVLDRITADAALGQLIDRERIAIAGHSYGAFTALTLIGMCFAMPDQGQVCLRDERVKLAIAMSPQGVGMFGLSEHSWNAIDRPALYMTGTHDRGLRSKSVEDRFEAFKHSPGPNQCQIVIRGANHYAFSDGQGIGLRPPPRHPKHHEYIQMATTAFLDGYLRDQPAAREWLRGDKLTAATHGSCRVEWKNRTM
ncbi:MAG: hypothetical protein JXO22_05705 [Phycisphaerae bacterium]|nr:hypothetical protein [Phycisphaerae bacterium]